MVFCKNHAYSNHVFTSPGMGKSWAPDARALPRDQTLLANITIATYYYCYYYYYYYYHYYYHYYYYYYHYHYYYYYYYYYHYH